MQRVAPSQSDQSGESIRVVADFAGTRVRPLAFQWGTKRYDVTKVHLVYRRRVGTRYHWCFSVSDEANTYVLAYDPETLNWRLDVPAVFGATV